MTEPEQSMATAAFIHGRGDIRIGPYTPPAAPDNWTNVHIEAVGICGSDLHYYKDGAIGSATIDKPFVPGHEFSARLSTDIEALSLERNQLVAVDPALPCHQCEWCFRGHHNLCPHTVFIGAPPYDGALTQQIAIPMQSIVALPSTISPVQAAMLEPLGVCIHAVDLAKPKLLETVAVLGCGPIGLGIVQLLNLAGVSTIYAVDPQSHRSAAAKAQGATASGESVDMIHDLTEGRGCDLVIEATNSPHGFSHAVKAARIGARLVLAGIPDGNEYAPLTAADARRKGLGVKFSRRMGHVYPRAIELVNSKKIDCDELVSHHFTLEDTASAFAMQADEAPGLIKSIVYPNGIMPSVSKTTDRDTSLG